MAVTYADFLKTGIDLAPLGVGYSDKPVSYFCTPREAFIFGSAGVDGIHFCFVAGWQDHVFAVSPMNGAPDYVHPIALSFEDFLRLLLACGDSAALEQAWQWDREQFDAFLAEYPPDDRQKAVLGRLAEALHLTPMEDPYGYLDNMQGWVDCSDLNCIDPDVIEMEAPDECPWGAWFGCGFGEVGQGQPGEAVAIDRHFDWAGRGWYIPAVYLCAEGLVIDICMAVDSDTWKAYLDRWQPVWDAGEPVSREDREAMRRGDPRQFHFRGEALADGERLRSGSCSYAFYDAVQPADSDAGARQAVHHYDLEKHTCWRMARLSLSREGIRQPAQLSLTLTADRKHIPGPVFSVEQAGDQAVFTDPRSGTEHTLTVRSYTREQLPAERVRDDRFELPTCFSLMEYTVEPELTDGEWHLQAQTPGDRPRRKAPQAPGEPITAVDVGVSIIGGADGPTTVFLGNAKQGKGRSAASNLTFVPLDGPTVWQMIFRQRIAEDQTVDLL